MLTSAEINKLVDTSSRYRYRDIWGLTAKQAIELIDKLYAEFPVIRPALEAERKYFEEELVRQNQPYRPKKILLVSALAAMLGSGVALLDNRSPYRYGSVPAGKPHDPERLKKAQERQAKKLAAREAIRKKNGHA